MRTSKHERIIRDELLKARFQFMEAKAAADAVKARIDTLERILAQADTDKTGGDDAES